MRSRFFVTSAAILAASGLFAQTPVPVVAENGGMVATYAMQEVIRLLLTQAFNNINQNLQSEINLTTEEYDVLVACSNILDNALADLDAISAALVDDFANGYISTEGDPHFLAEMLFALWDDTYQIAAYYGGVGQPWVDGDHIYQVPQNVYWIGNNVYKFLDQYGPEWVGAVTDAINRLNLDGVEVSVTNDVHIDAQMLEDWELSGANSETWNSFDALVDEYWDTSQFDHPLGYVTTNQWFEMNWWERVSCALYTLVSPDNNVTTPNTDTLTRQYDTMGSTINNMSFTALDKGEAVKDNLSVLADEVGSFATYNDGRLTIIPLISFPVTDTYTFSVGPVQWDVRNSPCYPLVGAMRSGCLWLWQFIAAVGMLAFFISVGGGAVYFATWLIKCASDLKVYPFEWEKVFVSPFRFFHF